MTETEAEAAPVTDELVTATAQEIIRHYLHSAGAADRSHHVGGAIIGAASTLIVDNSAVVDSSFWAEVWDIDEVLQEKHEAGVTDELKAMVRVGINSVLSFTAAMKGHSL